MSNRCQVHDLLHRAGGQHCKAGGTGSHNIGVVTEYRKGLGCKRAGCNMENARQKLACYLIHIRNHKKKALGCSECGGQGTSLQRAVYSSGSTAFGLHLYNFDLFAEKVFSPVGRPFINILGHRGGRSNRVNCRNFTEHIGNVCCSKVSIDCDHFLRHDNPLSF